MSAALPTPMAQFARVAQPFRFRVVADAEGFPVIPGQYGQIEYHDGTALAVYTDRPRLFAKLWAIPGVRRHQTGDCEMRALFPPEALEQVAQAIGARRKRTLAPEAAREMGAGTAYRATSRLQDRVRASGKGSRPSGGSKAA